MTTPTIAPWTTFTTVGPDTFVDYAAAVGAELVRLEDGGSDLEAIEEVAADVLALRELVSGHQQPTNGEVPATLRRIGGKLEQTRISLYTNGRDLLAGVQATFQTPSWVKAYRPRQVPRILDHIEDTVGVIDHQLRKIRLPAGNARNARIDLILHRKQDLENAVSDLHLLRDTILGYAHHPLRTLLFRLLSNEKLLELGEHLLVVPLLDELRDLYSHIGEEPIPWFGGNVLPESVAQMPSEARRIGPAPLQDDAHLDPARLSDDESHLLELRDY